MKEKGKFDGDLTTIIHSAKRLGIEMDESEAMQWLTAMAASKSTNQFKVDENSGVFGHQISMIDFDQKNLDYFRQIGKLIEFNDVEGVVETALSLSGSAAQSKIQTYPGDCDYFERVNIIADSKSAACAVLSKIMREKILSTFQGPTFRFIEAKFGNYPRDVIVDGILRKSGTPITWKPQNVKESCINGFSVDGTEVMIQWDDVADDPGWCKLDWVVADPIRGKVANASNMLDVTWEAPDGNITPLDGYLDPYFQEVYLDAMSIPLFSKLVKQVSPDALDHYVSQLRKEVKKYLSGEPNYGKVAKRMYNIFRLTGRYSEAAYIRELFDEPATVLYQVWSLARTLEEASTPDSQITTDALLKQADELIMEVVDVLEGEKESEIIRSLLYLRDSISLRDIIQTNEVERARANLIGLINNFYHDKLISIPEINIYMEEVMNE
jgi:hypothetical protein